MLGKKIVCEFLRGCLLLRIRKRIGTHRLRQLERVNLERRTSLLERRTHLLGDNAELRRGSCSPRRRRIGKGLARILAQRAARQYQSNHPDGCDSLHHTQTPQAPASCPAARAQPLPQSEHSACHTSGQQRPFRAIYLVEKAATPVAPRSQIVSPGRHLRTVQTIERL